MFILVTEKNYPPSGGFSSTRSKNNLAEIGIGRSIFLIQFTVNRYGKQLRAKLFLLPPLAFILKESLT
jgi:hypothetical protein